MSQEQHASEQILKETKLVSLALFAALIAVFGLVPRIDLPFLAGVPITLQTLGVMLAGVFLRPSQAVLAVGLFLLVVLLGAPFLSGGRGGIGVLFGPGAGFLLGWLLGAWVTSFVFRLVCKRTNDRATAGAIGATAEEETRTNPRLMLSCFVACLVGGIATIYSVGIPWLAWRSNIDLFAAAVVSMGFLPGDLLKATLASWVVTKLRPQVMRSL